MPYTELCLARSPFDTHFLFLLLPLLSHMVSIQASSRSDTCFLILFLLLLLLSLAGGVNEDHAAERPWGDMTLPCSLQRPYISLTPFLMLLLLHKGTSSVLKHCAQLSSARTTPF
jgi:hypothetical protein